MSSNPPNRKVTKADLAIALYERIELVKNNPKALRAMVYELARNTMAGQFGAEDTEEARQIKDMLEAAIGGVEHRLSKAGNDADRLPDRPDRASAAFSGVAPPAQESIDEFDPEALFAESAARLASRSSLVLGTILPLASAAAAIFIVLLAVISWFLPGMELLPFHSPQTAAAPAADVAPTTLEPAGSAATLVQSSPPPFVLPSTFGIYCLSEGQLQEIKPLPLKVPDRRVAISAPLTARSLSTIPSGEVKFILFKPDLLQDAPATGEVRVIAKVSLAMGVDSTGKAVSAAPATESWVIRNKSFPFKIGPVEGQPGMLLVRPEDENLVLKPGRYALGLKGTGYEFTVAGQVTDPDQCVERVDTANGTFYSPCPQR